jgi:CRISPR-associated protein Csm1
MFVDKIENSEKNESYKGDTCVIRNRYTTNNFNCEESNAINLLVGNYTMQNDTNKTLVDFEQIISFDDTLPSHEKEGIKRISVLRADVDNLGSNFKTGFSECLGDNTIMKYSAISKQLTLFYKFYINSICKNICKKDNLFSLISGNDVESRIVICYSGGDDVFIIGALNHILEFSIKLKKAFYEYTSGYLNFSAGIGMFKVKYPVYKMAQIAGELEHIAKEMKNEEERSGTKNSVALFELEFDVYNNRDVSIFCKHTYKWESFITDIYIGKLQKLYSWFNINNSTEIKTSLEEGNTFFYNMYQLLHNVGKNNNHQENSNDKINIARLAYLIARHEPKQNKGESDETYCCKKKKFEELANAIVGWSKCEKNRKELLTALQIVLYLNRKRSGDNG